jgi:hypothetical protein
LSAFLFLNVSAGRAAQTGDGRPLFDLQASLGSAKARFGGDETWKAISRVVIETAGHYVTHPEENSLSQHSKDGLAQARQCERIVFSTSFAYALTGDEGYRKRAVNELLSLSSTGKDGQPVYPQWSDGKNFLSMAEMATCFGLGYRWNRQALNDDQRKLVLGRLADAALNPETLKNPLASHFSPSGSQYSKGNFASSNWNGVVNGGLSVAAMAIYSDPDAPAGFTKAGHSTYDAILRAFDTYVPAALGRMSSGSDRSSGGVWDESLTYYSYFATYLALAFAGHRDVYGVPNPLENDGRLRQSADFFLAMVSPSFGQFNFGDNGPDLNYTPISYFALMENRPRLAQATHNFLRWYISSGEPETIGGKKINYNRLNRFLPFYLLWYRPQPQTDALASWPLARIFKGTNGNFFSVRSSWTDRNALFLAAKASRSSATHGKMDAGTFVVDRKAVRWATDMGSYGNYGVAHYFGGIGKRAYAGRWQYFANNNLSQNTLVFYDSAGNASPQDPNGVPGIVNANLAFPGTHAVFDLSPAYRGAAASVIRTFSVDSPNDLTIEDRFSPEGDTARVRWATAFCKTNPGRDSITVIGGRAVLKKNGLQAVWTIEAPQDAHFVLESLDPSVPLNDRRSQADRRVNEQRGESESLNMPKANLCSRLAVYANTATTRNIRLSLRLP